LSDLAKPDLFLAHTFSKPHIDFDLSYEKNAIYILKSEPLEQVKRCVGEGPIDEGFELKEEGNCLKDLIAPLIRPSIAFHKNKSSYEFWNTILQLESREHKVDGIKDIEPDCWRGLEWIGDLISIHDVKVDKEMEPKQ